VRRPKRKAKTTALSFGWTKAPARDGRKGAVGFPGAVHVLAGGFTMGLPSSEPNRSSNGTRHSVKLSAFSIGRNEVTHGEWREVMVADPSSFTGDDRLPVENVNWCEALAYCNRRSIKEGLDPC
jgi:sulfatase modifying factor 1